jgi:hypothetical protein
MFNYDETLPDHISTLIWGLAIGQMKEFAIKYGVEIYYDNNDKSLCIGGIALQNFPGDCGALILNGANTATLKSLAIAEDYASRSGFSVIVGTICAKDVSSQLEVFKAAGWEAVNSYASNRNPDKTHVVVVKRIKNCLKKGY